MRLAIGLIILIILVAILGPQTFYSVDETQVAIVTRFGQFKRANTTPGLHFKTPFVDTVTRFDKRLLRHDAVPASVLTKDKKNLIIDAYARYRIVDPLVFFQTLRDELGADARVGDIIASELRREIALDDQSDVISENREAIMNRIREAAAEKASEFGIEIIDVRIKRADFPTEIAQSIFSRMDAERERIAKGFRAEGTEEDNKIRAEVDKQVTIILANAEKQANIARGEGEAEAIKILADALEQDPEFFAFRRSLEAYTNFLAQNTTVVLPADSDLFQFLQSPFSRVTASSPPSPTSAETGPPATPTPSPTPEAGSSQ